MNSSRNLFRFFNQYFFTHLGQSIKLKREKFNINYSPPNLIKYSLALALLWLSPKLKAQEVTKASSFLGRTEFKIGYFGNIFSNDGINLGAEYLWKEKVRIKERRKGQKTIRRQLLLNGSMSYSTNFGTKTQNGIFVNSGLTLRRLNSKDRGLFVELNPLGLYRSVIPTTYEVVGDEVKQVWFSGKAYYAPSVAIGIGRFPSSTKRFGWYLQLQQSIVTNYNAGFLPVDSLHFGIKFRL